MEQQGKIGGDYVQQSHDNLKKTRDEKDRKDVIVYKSRVSKFLILFYRNFNSNY